jgi:hypothetical protein
MRGLFLLSLLLVPLSGPIHAASPEEGWESYTPAPWAAACAPSATLDHAPVWFRSFSPTAVAGETRDLGPEGAGLRLLRHEACNGQPVELTATLGFCVGESWSSAEIALSLAPLDDETVETARLALRPVGSAHFVQLPSTLSSDGKLRLRSDAFPLGLYQDPLHGEIEVLLHVFVRRAAGACEGRGGQGVSVRSVSLGVPPGG